MNENLKAESNGLSVASFIFGILALLSSFVMVLTPFFAPMAIAFAWLSRGKGKMHWQAVAGNLLALLSIVISIAVLMVLCVVFMAAISAALSGLDTETLRSALEQILANLR